MDDWTRNLIDDPAEISRIAANARRIAVLGIKPESMASQPAHYVPKYLAQSGIEIVPVPVYHSDVTIILGRPVVRDLARIEGAIDIVDVFRRPEDVDAHVEALIALRPAVVWLQAGIRNDGAAERLARAGIRVVQNRCLMVEHRRGRALGSTS